MLQQLLAIALVTVAAGACDGSTEPVPPKGPVPIVRFEGIPTDTTVDVLDDVVLKLRAVNADGQVVASLSALVTVTSDKPLVASTSPVVDSVTTIAANQFGVATVAFTASNAGIPGASAVSAIVHVTVRPRVVLLPLPSGYQHVEVYGVADDRTVGGAAYLINGDLPHAWSWSAAGGSRLLPGPAATQPELSQVRGVAGNGTLTGYADGHLMRWSATGVGSDLGVGGTIIGMGINRVGQIAYYSNVSMPTRINRAYLRSADGTIIPIARLDTDGESIPVAIAEDGSVTASAVDNQLRRWAVVWSAQNGTRFITPQPLPGSIFSAGIATGERVVGAVSVGPRAENLYHGFYWSPTEGFTDIGTLPGDTYSQAAAINDRGEVVGFSKRPSSVRAFVWTRAGGMIDLGQYLPRASQATAISVTGVVAGTMLSGTTSPRLDLNEQPVLWILRRP